MKERKIIDPEILSKLKDEHWLRQKLIDEKYSCSRLAKELGTTRTTVEKYRVLFNIEQPLSPKELASESFSSRTEKDKQSILEKRKQTNIKKYGVENLFQSKEKIEQAMLKKYGVKRALQLKEFYNKRTQTMIEKYGVGYAARKHIPHETINKIENKDWLVKEHIIKKKTLKQIAFELSIDPTTVERACNRTGTEIKYHYESAQQREVSDWLLALGVKVETNVRNIINGELDIFLPEYNLAIEYCGVFWHSDAHARITPMYHLNKLRQCKDKNIRLITLYEDEWVYTKDIVKQKIITILGKNHDSFYARKCNVVEVKNKKTKKTFFDSYHIQGDGPGSITYGLEQENEIVAMMTFIRQSDNTYILNRYASKNRVVGGFQKLLKHFQNTHSWSQIISFADLRWSNGEVYYKSGFVLDKVLRPDYKYVIGNKTFHKFAFRRKYLPAILGIMFDPTLSETENMRRAGYYRIWNCGLMRFVLNKAS